MKELFREADVTRVNYFRSLLEANGVPTMVRNEHLTGAGLTEIPIPEFYPALCVMRDEDYEAAVALIREHLNEDAGADGSEHAEFNCPSCGEPVPGNFASCWSCGESFASEEPAPVTSDPS